MDFLLVNSEGKEFSCKLLYTFSNNDIDYIIYTDGTLDSSGLEEVYASRYELINDRYMLNDIENDSEWDLIDEFLVTKIKK